jgi:hypothetical protein
MLSLPGKFELYQGGKRGFSGKPAISPAGLSKNSHRACL